MTCHNPYTVQSATNTSFDMMVMTHQIHMGGNLAMPFAVWIPGTSTTAGRMEYPFEGVTYPQDIRNCTACHNDSEAGSAWRTTVSVAACGSCHDSTTFSGPNPTHSAGPATDEMCSACHAQSNLPQLSAGGAHAASTAPVLLPSTPAVRAYARRFRFEIVSLDAATFKPRRTTS